MGLNIRESCTIIMLIFIFCVNGFAHISVQKNNSPKEQEFQITGESYQKNPAIYGDYVVWEDDKNGNWDIYGYNLTTQQEFQITSDDSYQKNPAIYGDHVVWVGKGAKYLA